MNPLPGLLSSEDHTVEAHLVLAVLAVLVYLGLAIYAVLHGQPFNGSDFGQGLGLVMAGTGLAAAGIGVQRRQQRKKEGE